MSPMGHGASQVESKDAARGFLAVRISQMNPQHDLAVLDLAGECGAGPVLVTDLRAELAQKRSRAWVAIAGQYWEKEPDIRSGPEGFTLAEHFTLAVDKVVGYLHVRVFRHYVVVKQIVVQSSVRRRSIAKQLLLPAVDLLHPTTRRLMLADVPEDNAAAHYFFRSAGFRCEDPRLRKRKLRVDAVYRFVLSV
jgi:ribosomal protein S18 acetylase RimI-like enzyme